MLIVPVSVFYPHISRYRVFREDPITQMLSPGVRARIQVGLQILADLETKVAHVLFKRVE